MRIMKTKLLVVLLAVGVVAACTKSDDKKAPETKPEPAATPKPEAKPASPDFGDLFASYEACRALLTADKLEGVTDCAGKVAAAAKAAGQPEIAAKAEAMAGTAADDMAALRLAFGEVSKPLVALLGSSPDVASNYHVFECPMAKGYQRWVQPTATLENPYMGQKMLACGSEVSD